MTFTSRTVLIPIIGAGETDGRIIRVQADSSLPERNDAGLDPQINQLNDWQLYEAGAIALGAVKRLQLSAKRMALFHRLKKKPVSGTLSVTNGPDIVGLHCDHNKSAELGLALGLLMYAGQSRDHVVIATGCLARAADPASVLSDDVDVLPVEGLSTKIETIRRSLDQYKGDARTSRFFFFLPDKTSTGEKVSEEFAADLERLKRDFNDRGLKLRICPVSTLREATEKLGIKALEVTTADKLFAGGVIAAISLASLSIAAWLWLSAPIELSFAQVTLASGDSVSSPTRAQYNVKAKRYTLVETCIGDRNLPAYKAGEWMIVRTRISAAGWFTSVFGGYHFALVSVSEKSGIKVFPPNTFHKGLTNRSDETSVSGELSVALPVTGPAESNKIIILARRLSPFNVEALQQGLTKEIADVPPARYVNRTVSYLSQQAPGYLDYSFLSVVKEPECAD